MDTVSYLIQLEKERPQKAAELARNLLLSMDIDIRMEALYILGNRGKKEDLNDLLEFVNLNINDEIELMLRSDIYYRAALLEAIIKIEPKKSDLVTQILDKELEPYIINSVLRVALFSIPENVLIKWSNIPKLNESKAEIFNKLMSLPRTKNIEDFFVNFLINDDGLYPDLTVIANNALEKLTPSPKPASTTNKI